MGKFKDAIHFIADIATIIGCGVAIIGVMQVIRFVVEVRPVVKEFHQIRDTVSVYHQDTVIVHKNIVRRDTVFVYKNSTVPSTYISEEEKTRIDQNEKAYRDNHPEVFSPKK